MANIPTVQMERARFEGEGQGIVNLIKELGLVPSNSEGFRTIAVSYTHLCQQRRPC